MKDGIYSEEERRIIGYNIKRIREQKGWSQDAFALSLGKTSKTVQRIEKGESGKLYACDVNLFAEKLECKTEELFMDSFDLSRKKMLEETKDHTIPVVNIEEIRIQSIYDFLIYSPLIEPYSLLDVISGYSSSPNKIEPYIALKLNELYESIENKDARKYADYISKCSTIRNGNHSQYKKSCELKEQMFKENEFSKCAEEYFFELKKYRRLLPYTVKSSKEAIESYDKMINELEDSNPILAKHLKLDRKP